MKHFQTFSKNILTIYSILENIYSLAVSMFIIYEPLYTHYEMEMKLVYLSISKLFAFTFIVILQNVYCASTMCMSKCLSHTH